MSKELIEKVDYSISVIDNCLLAETEYKRVNSIKEIRSTLEGCKAALSQKQEADTAHTKSCKCGDMFKPDSYESAIIDVFGHCSNCEAAIPSNAPISSARELLDKYHSGVEFYTAPPSTAQVSRDDVIQCIFATHKQSEGVMADAILSLFNQPSQPTAQGVEELLENDWCYAHECKAGERVYDITAVRKLLASQPTAQDGMVDDFHSDARDAARYRYIKANMEWHKSGSFRDQDSHAFVGCRFPYLANFSSSVMLDHNIDKILETESGDKQ